MLSSCLWTHCGSLAHQGWGKTEGGDEGGKRLLSMLCMHVVAD